MPFRLPYRLLPASHFGEWIRCRKRTMECTNEPIAQHLSLKSISRLLDVNTTAIRRRICDGKFPKPDVRRGRIALWKASTIAAWLAGGNTSST